MHQSQYTTIHHLEQKCAHGLGIAGFVNLVYLGKCFIHIHFNTPYYDDSIVSYVSLVSHQHTYTHTYICMQYCSLSNGYRTYTWIEHHNECKGILNNRHLDCLLNRLFRHTSKETSKLSVTGLYDEKPPVTDGFPSQRASNAQMFQFDDVIIKANIPLRFVK